jgi:hypothetical protein
MPFDLQLALMQRQIDQAVAGTSTNSASTSSTPMTPSI